MTNEDRSGVQTGQARGEEEALQSDIERTRAELGDTVEALAAKADVKSRVKDKAGQIKQDTTTLAHEKLQTVREKAAPAGRQAREKAGRLGAKAREAATAEDGQKTRRGGAIVIVGTALAAAGLLVWRARRKRQVPPTMSERLRAKAGDMPDRLRARTGDMPDRVRAKATEFKDSDFAAQATERGQVAASQVASGVRQAAAAPDTKPRLQGAAAAAALMMVAGRARRRSR